MGETCAFDTCGPSSTSCNLNCGPEATCTGSCGTGCQVACNGKQCTHTVGVGANVSCTKGICNITCTGACSVASVAGTTLNLTCSGGIEFAGGCQ
jgi:hypothetical protein